MPIRQDRGYGLGLSAKAEKQACEKTRSAETQNSETGIIYIIPQLLRQAWPAQDGPMIEDDVDNWARWARQKLSHKSRCYSAEGSYRSPQWGHWDEAPPKFLPKIDILRAQACEDALHDVFYPVRYRWLLKLVYVQRMQPYAVCRMLRRLCETRWKPSELPIQLGLARLALQKVLDSRVSITQNENQFGTLALAT